MEDSRRSRSSAFISRPRRWAREAVDVAELTDSLAIQGDAYCDLAEVLTAAGKPVEARAALQQALDRYERKRNIVMAKETRPRLSQANAAG